MNQEPLEKQKVRIIEIDRKVAAHLADVCYDMNRMIEKTTESLKKEKKERRGPSHLSKDIKQRD